MEAGAESAGSGDKADVESNADTASACLRLKRLAGDRILAAADESRTDRSPARDVVVAVKKDDGFMESHMSGKSAAPHTPLFDFSSPSIL